MDEETMRRMQALHQALASANAEAYIDQKEIHILSPKALDKDQKHNIIASLPEGYQLIFEVRLRPQVKAALYELICRAATGEGKLNFEEKPNLLTINIEGEVDLDQVWMPLCELLKRDGTYSAWKIGDRLYDPTVITDVQGHRTGPVISKDDVMDVKIALGQAETIEDFLKLI